MEQAGASSSRGGGALGRAAVGVGARWPGGGQRWGQGRRRLGQGHGMAAGSARAGRRAGVQAAWARDVGVHARARRPEAGQLQWEKEDARKKNILRYSFLRFVFTGTDVRRNFPNHKFRIQGPKLTIYGSCFYGHY
jgi:hypothetical protein